MHLGAYQQCARGWHAPSSSALRSHSTTWDAHKWRTALLPNFVTPAMASCGQEGAGMNAPSAEVAVHKTSRTHGSLLEQFKQRVPELTGVSYKGQHGKVMVLGGCREFTGAPFFAGVSALKAGADMAYVVCSESAAPAIKAYSPELMVLPYLPERPLDAVRRDVLSHLAVAEQEEHSKQPQTQHQEKGEPQQQTKMACEQQQHQQQLVRAAAHMIAPWLARATVLVVGPGLGDDPWVTATAAEVMRQARVQGMPVVVDGSALSHIVAQDPSVVCGYERCVLTPNIAELGRLAAAVGQPLPGRMGTHWQAHAHEVAAAFRGPSILAKGPADMILQPIICGNSNASGSGNSTSAVSAVQLLECREVAALRRCGGQGDVLAGTLAAFLCWATKSDGVTGGNTNSNANASSSGHGSSTGASQGAEAPGPYALAAYAACSVMRSASAAAFTAQGRGLLAGDIIPLLPHAVDRVLARL